MPFLLLKNTKSFRLLLSASEIGRYHVTLSPQCTSHNVLALNCIVNKFSEMGSRPKNITCYILNPVYIHATILTIVTIVTHHSHQSVICHRHHHRHHSVLAIGVQCTWNQWRLFKLGCKTFLAKQFTMYTTENLKRSSIWRNVPVYVPLAIKGPRPTHIWNYLVSEGEFWNTRTNPQSLLT